MKNKTNGTDLDSDDKNAHRKFGRVSTLINHASLLWDIGKRYRPRSDTAA